MAHLFAATRPVNPPGAEPVLTEAQLWRAWSISCETHSRVPGCQVTVANTDPSASLVREMTFVDGRAFEVTVESHAPTIMYFETSTGVRITNLITYGADDELLLTYSFANGRVFKPVFNFLQIQPQKFNRAKIPASAGDQLMWLAGH
ncbi:hypothetical protein C8R46DRAFT_1042649 [Mycena filopes]|nr:hypothetical protein C8R46DRAFT_1042649 [Mycena filopes]